MSTRTVAAGEFKTHCLRILDEVQRRRTSVVITKRGKPVAKLLPVDGNQPSEIFGCMVGRIEVVGDIIAPAVPEDAWEMIRK